jgi:hypothetical protein
VLRNLVAVVAGVTLSPVLNFLGWRLLWLLLIGDLQTNENRDAIVWAVRAQMFLVVPLTCLVVGGFVALIVRRPAWWLGGVAVLPILFGFIFMLGAHRLEILLLIAYVLLTFTGAFVASRFKRTHLT